MSIRVCYYSKIPYYGAKKLSADGKYFARKKTEIHPSLAHAHRPSFSLSLHSWLQGSCYWTHSHSLTYRLTLLPYSKHTNTHIQTHAVRHAHTHRHTHEQSSSYSQHIQTHAHTDTRTNSQFHTHTHRHTHSQSNTQAHAHSLHFFCCSLTQTHLNKKGKKAKNKILDQKWQELKTERHLKGIIVYEI